MLHTTYVGYRKIPKISPRAYFVSKALFEGLIYGGKFAFQNCLGLPYSRNEIYRFALYLRAISRGGGGRLFGGAYFWNCTVLQFKRRPFSCQLAPEPLMVNSSERRLKDKNLVLLSEMIK